MFSKDLAAELSQAAVTLAWPSMKVYTCVLFLACAVVSAAQRRGTVLDEVPGSELGPVYELQVFISPGLNYDDRGTIERDLNVSGIIGSSKEVYYEWETFDGWYNNPAHPEWGGTGKRYLALNL